MRMNLVTEAKSDYLDFINLISKLEWFCNLHRVLTPPASDNEENIDEIHDEPSKKLVDLYRAILLYEIRIVCFHFGHLYFDFVGVTHEIEQVPLDRSEAKRQVDEAEKAFSLLNCSQVKVQLEKLLEETSVHDKEQSQPDKESQLMRDLHIALRKWTRRLEPEGSYTLPDLYQWILSTQEYKEFLDWDKADPKLLPPSPATPLPAKITHPYRVRPSGFETLPPAEASHGAKTPKPAVVTAGTGKTWSEKPGVMLGLMTLVVAMLL